MIATEINILPFYTSLGLQHHQKRYAYGQHYCLPTPAGFLVPFQLRRDNTGAAVTELVVVEVATGTETDILYVASVSGLEVVEYAADGYDLIIFPGTLSVGSFNVGRHYLRMGDGTNTWYSEVFNFVDTTSGLVMVEWWHSEDFCYPSGRVRYNYPYKGRVYLKTDIGKPEYTFEQVVSERNGKNLKLKQISAKQYKFVFLAPEYLADAFRQIPLHDFVEITNYNGVTRTYTVDEINMATPDWQDRGDVGAITVDFQTDTVIVKSGTGTTTLEYDVGPGGCLPVDLECVAELTQNYPPYSGGYYIRDSDGEQVDLELGDLVLVRQAAAPINRQVYEVGYPIGSNYILQVPVAGQVSYDANTGRYYFYDASDGYRVPTIDTYISNVLAGRTFPNTLNSIYQVEAGVHTLLDTVTAAEITAGVTISPTVGADYLYFKVQTPACPLIVESSPYYIMKTPPIGVGYDTIEDDLIVY